MKAFDLISKINQKLSYILSSIIGKRYENISHEEINELKSEVSVLKEQIEAEGEVLKVVTDNVIQANYPIILGSAVNILGNKALHEQGFFKGLEDEDILEIITLEERDIDMLLEYEEHARVKIEEFYGDDPELVKLVFKKLEEVIADANAR